MSLGALAALGAACASAPRPEPAAAAALPASRGPVRVSAEAAAVHRAGFVFDGHNDLPWALRERVEGDLSRIDLNQSQPELHTDIPRLRAGGVGAQYWSVYIPADSPQPLHEVSVQIDLVHRMLERYPDTFALALDADDVEDALARGKIASLIGIEGGNAIEESLPVLRMLYRMGARYMTLTHADTLSWADAATDDPSSEHDPGLSAFGEEVVREMNRLGMLVDLSHVSEATMDDALRVSTAPVIFSHSSAYGVAAHPRNVPDEILVRVRDNGGIVMINFASGFVVPESARKMLRMFDVLRGLRSEHPDDADYEAAVARWRASNPIDAGNVHHVVDHIEHVARVAGVDHVGLGSDYDGVPLLPEQLGDVSTYPVLTQVLLERGWSAADVHKVLGGNALRVLREAQAAAGPASGARLGAGDE